jgi:CheY-like chemotaxis protein
MVEERPVLVIVDDDETDRTFIRSAIEEIGLDVQIEEFVNGWTFMKHVTGGHAGTTRSIILDLNMPIVSGMEVLAFLSENPSLCRAPVIIFSTSANEKDKEAALQLGAMKYIPKPAVYNGYIALAEHLRTFIA